MPVEGSTTKVQGTYFFLNIEKYINKEKEEYIVEKSNSIKNWPEPGTLVLPRFLSDFRALKKIERTGLSLGPR
jgi:hypothetical protein